MPQTVSIGYQDFETIQKNKYFYIDKTKFIREWWERGDSVTLITRPRRFGKTLTLSMVEKFFSMDAAGQGGAGVGVEAPHVVPLPAVEGHGDGVQRLQRPVRVHA